MDTHEYAWAAGFFDGEGHITATNRRGIRVAISNTDRRLLERLVVLFGGAIYPKTREGQKLRPGQDRANWRPCFQYQLWKHEDVEAMVAAIWLWLGEAKRAQATAALAHSNGAKHVDHEHARRLRERGMTYQQIAEKLGCSLGSAWRAAYDGQDMASSFRRARGTRG